MTFNFGSTATAAPATSSGFNFGSTTTATPASGGFSFGGLSTSTSSTSSSGGFSFSSSAPLTVSTTPSTSSFSFPSTTTQPTTSSGFSFGGNTTTPSTGFNLGGSTTTPATGFSFGGTASNAPTTSPTFGFGSTPANTLGSTTNSFGFGTTTPAIPTPTITMDTLFSSLPSDIQKNMTEFQIFLKEQDRSESFFKTVSSQPLEQLETSLKNVQQQILIHRNRQDQQGTSVAQVRQQVQQLIHQVDQATLTLRTRQGDATAQRNPYYGIIRACEQPSGFYTDLVEQFENRMLRIKELIQVVESELLLSSQNVSTMDSRSLQSILIQQQQSLLQMAGLVSQVHEETEQMRELYLKKIKEDLRRHGDTTLTTFKNPFEKKKKKDSNWYEIDAIRFKTSVAPTIIQQIPASTTTNPVGGTTTNLFGTNTTTGTGAIGTAGTTSLFPSTANTTTPSTSFFSTNLDAKSTPAGTIVPASTSTTPASTPFTLGGSKTVSFGSTAPAPVATTPASSSFTFAPVLGTPTAGGLGEKRSLSSSGSGNKSSGSRSRTRKR